MITFKVKVVFIMGVLADGAILMRIAISLHLRQGSESIVRNQPIIHIVDLMGDLCRAKIVMTRENGIIPAIPVMIGAHIPDFPFWLSCFFVKIVKYLREGAFGL